MISLIAQERLLGFALGATVVGVAVLEQHRAIHRSISAQNPSPPPPEEIVEFVSGPVDEELKVLIHRKKSHVDLAHMWNKAVDGTLGPVIAALSSRGW